MLVLRADGHKRMPWKNGKGETVEIAVYPPDADLDNFEWRVSMATVTTDGPFSVFSGVDRTLSVIDGEGIVLLMGAQEVDLRRASSPQSFPADVKIDAKLIAGPITDLNVMTRRKSFSHGVAKLAVPMKLDRTGAHTLVLCCRGQIELETGQNTKYLAPFDAALLSPGETARLSGAGEGFLIAIQPGRL